MIPGFILRPAAIAAKPLSHEVAKHEFGDTQHPMLVEEARYEPVRKIGKPVDRIDCVTAGVSQPGCWRS